MLWFLFNNNNMLIKLNNNQVAIPEQKDITRLAIQIDREVQIGVLENSPCYAAEFSQVSEALPDGFAYMSLRKLFFKTGEEVFGIAGRAYQIIHWIRTHQYCGKCGSLMENKAGELARKCPNCGMTSYPRISPAVIVAVVKDEQLLMASNISFPTSFYSVLAGFVEPGETLEACVQREIKEEVGIEVKNITYFGSQPWPFPDSLMIGFTAEYASGEITVNNTELATADWFTRSQLPGNIPNIKTIAGRLIEWFLQGGTHGLYSNNKR
ncbi:NADH pyrophosphatase [Sporotomaculum syntrophicum]|uniref:NAD(+) diphosphatase n=1 Tax=Sporotomaculum syntrophicum TaxID=182264 RepID=A0A9D3AYQ7_9FIRM|nr:NAD(+) diphosphatase [Sporotomaculum syntrophicum]KAF1085706.1 NADH pyrophosphatase [Sporotomaculum syntrophicum]